MDTKKPLIAVTIGDPAGIGPEIIVGAWSETVVHEWCRPVVVGHPEIVRRAVDLWQMGQAVVEVDSPELAQPSAGRDPVHPLRVVRRAGRNAGHARRPRRPGGVRRRAGGHPAGAGQEGRCHRHRAAAKGGVAPCGPRLSRSYGASGPRLRGRRLCHDALPGAQRRGALARRVGRGPRHAAHGDAERVCPVDRGGDFGQGPAGPSVHVAVDAAHKAATGWSRPGAGATTRSRLYGIAGRGSASAR